MPLYNASANPAAVYPGQQYKLFDGTEAPAAGAKSAVFERAPNYSGAPSPMVFTVTFLTAPTATVLIMGSNDNVDSHFQTLATMATQLAYYSDAGSFRYYRATLSAYSAGSMPTVIAQL